MAKPSVDRNALGLDMSTPLNEGAPVVDPNPKGREADPRADLKMRQYTITVRVQNEETGKVYEETATTTGHHLTSQTRSLADKVASPVERRWRGEMQAAKP